MFMYGEVTTMNQLSESITTLPRFIKAMHQELHMKPSSLKQYIHRKSKTLQDKKIVFKTESGRLQIDIEKFKYWYREGYKES